VRGWRLTKKPSAISILRGSGACLVAAVAFSTMSPVAKLELGRPRDKSPRLLAQTGADTN